MSQENSEIKISLLFPDGNDKSISVLKKSELQTLMKDLEIHELLFAMGIDNRYDSKLRSVALALTDNPKIIKYRLDIIEDLINNPNLCSLLEELLPVLDELLDFKAQDSVSEDAVYHINRLHELELYAECIKKLHSFLKRTDTRINSEGLTRLKVLIDEKAESESFIALTTKLPHIRAGFSQIASITVGINLDAQLKPVNATLVSINEQKFKSGDLIDRLLSMDFMKDGYHGISPLDIVVKGSGGEAESQRFALQMALNNSLNTVFKSAVKSFSPTIKKYKQENTGFLSLLAQEVYFYLGALKLINKMKDAGLPMCKPKVAEKDERICSIRGLYNIRLALQMHSNTPEANLEKIIVTNEVEFDETGRIFVLTGPNQGGKTTFTQAVGLAQYLFQMGVYVPAEYALMSPVDMIYTHFPVEESATTYKGRLGEECSRLKDMFGKITSHSLVLLNESLASTSPREGAYIAREVLCGLKLAQCRALFATHFHELGENLEDTNSAVPGDSKIESLVAGLEDKSRSENDGTFNGRSYIITRRPPQGLSYAADIANKYGISLERIRDILKERNRSGEDKK